jgi:hypothetical protein
MVGKKAENSPKVMILIKRRTTAMTNRIIPRPEVLQLLKIRSFICADLNGEKVKCEKDSEVVRYRGIEIK